MFPGLSLQVTIAFCTSVKLLKSQEIYFQRRQLKHEYNQDLVIEYNNKSTQRIPLQAFLALPFFELSTNNVDFGTCLVGQTRRTEIFLLNKTGSKSYWTAVFGET
ncbi:hypothetical protein scyTo_0019829 [Scyliorhinus torazame]|uniref:Uncharacterized protein n=1 Tax=Scyliorhinus torazame TaxID=75743 RepID=A0A401PS70_SCYTO|nr:hypothetical protein [Scyliorhinus torazame]